jgi:hypothetical protein
MIWGDNLSADEPAVPGYIRGGYTLDPGHAATVTAEAMEFERLLQETPQPHDAGTP